MRKISIGFTIPEIEINGIKFKVMKSDKAIVQDMMEIDNAFKDKDLNDVSVVIEKNDVMLGYLDKLFGDGATQQIIDSIPQIKEYGFGLSGLDLFLGRIVQAAGNAYSDAITLKYND